MNNLNKYNNIIIIILVVAVVVLAAMLIAKDGTRKPLLDNAMNSGALPSSTIPTSTTPTSPAPAAQSGGNKAATPTATKPAPTGFTIHLVTPVPNDTWIITQSNLIIWDREAGVTGQIELLDASTLKLAGVILGQTGTHQTSYTWNTRDIFLSRTNPSKTTVAPGRYVIRLRFDGNNLSPVTSPVITIVQ